MASPHQLSYNEFMKYKDVNQNMTPVLIDLYNANKNKFNKHNHHVQPKKTDWGVAKKLKQPDEDKLFGLFRGILNKLSDSNFNSMAQELTSLEITKQEQLIKLADLIFTKAITENKFSLTYAKLARELAGYYIKENDKQIYFRELLINKCQTMFNDCLLFEGDAGKTISRDMACGCMKFVGELYNCDLLTNKIINSCFMLLILKVNHHISYIIECICILMKSVIKKFIEKCPTEAHHIFDKLNKFIESGLLQNKDKFALMDIIELQKVDSW